MRSIALAHLFAVVLAVTSSCAVAQGADRTRFVNQNRADLCGHVNAPITAYARHGRMKTKIGLVQRCMCMSDLPQHLYDDPTARDAVHILGERAALDALTDLLESARDARTCQFPPNSVPSCTSTDPCNFVCKSGYTPHPNAHAPTSCECIGESCHRHRHHAAPELVEQVPPPTKVKRDPGAEEDVHLAKRHSPSLKPRHAEPSLKPRHAEPSLKPRHAQPSLKPRHAEPSLKPRHATPSLKPRHAEPSLKPRHATPSLKARHAEPSLKPRHAEPSLKPRHATPSLKPRHAEPTLKPRHATPSLKPRHATPSLKPRHAEPSLKPRHATPSLKPRHAEPSLKPRHATPSLKPRHAEPSLKPRHATPSLKPRHAEPSLKPRHAEPSLKPRHAEPSLKPRHVEPSLKPRHVAPSLKPRAPSPSLHAREPEPAPVPAPEPAPIPVPSNFAKEKRDAFDEEVYDEYEESYEDEGEYDEDWRHEIYKLEYDCGDWTTCGTKNGHTGLAVRDSRAWECVNTWRDLESCGGCMVPFPFPDIYASPVGQDCTAIEGVEDVECRMGSCLVHRCDTSAGWHVSEDRSTCVRVESHSDHKTKKPSSKNMAGDYGLEHVPLVMN